MKNPSLLETKNERYSFLLADYQICQSCHVVDKDKSRTVVGYECPICHKRNQGGRFYFHMGILSLVDLIQEAYHSEYIIDDTSFETPSHTVSIIIFYCALREALIHNFLNELAELMNIPSSLYSRLLSDNKTYAQKQNKLFPSFLELEWKQALVELSKNGNENYADLDIFLKKVADARNTFLHEGDRFVITKMLAVECIDNIDTLLRLYVDLHNHYVHPKYLHKCI
jgi:hypothetical protein